jgi:hypothetical protein
MFEDNCGQHRFLNRWDKVARGFDKVNDSASCGKPPGFENLGYPLTVQQLGGYQPAEFSTADFNWAVETHKGYGSFVKADRTV